LATGGDEVVLVLGAEAGENVWTVTFLSNMLKPSANHSSTTSVGMDATWRNSPTGFAVLDALEFRRSGPKSGRGFPVDAG
jgi:hypothetical protein